MSNTSYALTNISSQFKDDGTKTFIELTLAEADPARFYVSLEGASALASQINMVCRKMIELQSQSGAAKIYQGETASVVDPYQVLSARAGLSEDRTTLVLSLQTQEGPLLEFAMESDMARKLLSAPDESASTTSITPH